MSNYTATAPRQIPVTAEQVAIYREHKAAGRTVLQMLELMKLGNARLVRVKDKSDYMASIES